MSFLAERLRAQFDAAVMPPPPPRRQDQPVVDDGDGDGDGDDDVDDTPVVAPAGKRARTDAYVNITSVENEALFTPLRDVYNDRSREHMADIVKSAAERQVSCFFCECGSTSLDHTSGTGTWVIGYNLMINWIRNNWAVRSDIAVAKETVRIYQTHIRDPCLAANGGVAPVTLVDLTVEDVLTHIRDHTRHPVVTQMLLMDTLKQLVVGLSARVFVNGVPDVKVAAALVTAVGKLDAMNDKCRALFDKETDLVLDPMRVNALANTHRLESLQMRSADALGGATASGSSASIAAVASMNERPSFRPAQQLRGSKRRLDDAALEPPSTEDSDVALSDL